MNNNFVQVDKKELAHIIGGRNSYDYIDSGQFGYDMDVQSLIPNFSKD